MSDLVNDNWAQFALLKENPDFGFGLGQQFVAGILGLPAEQRFEHQALLEAIAQDAFERSISIPNLDIESFLEEKARWQITPAKTGRPQKFTVDDFNVVLRETSNTFLDLLGRMKGVFIFKLRNGNTSQTAPIFIFNEGTSKHPDFRPIAQSASIQSSPIDEFIKTLEQNETAAQSSYLVIALVAAGKAEDQGALKSFEGISTLFDDAKFISPKRLPMSAPDDYDELSFEKGIETARSYCSKVFNNRDLSFGDELIIKTLFEGDMLLDYKFLKKGNTGANVIEVRPLTSFGGDAARWVIKYGDRAERKIELEYKRFKQYVDIFGLAGYSADLGQTGTHEGIRYRYASEDAKTDSIPLAEIIDIIIDPKKAVASNREVYSPRIVIGELFSNQLFSHWTSTDEEVSRPVGEMYADYLNKEAKVFETIGTILNQDASQIASSTFATNHKKICQSIIRTKFKCCHGDLHSENSFKDNVGMYLIDFGWTEKRHAVMDHATLECSIKFKHIPRFIDDLELVEIERSKLLHMDSFQEGFPLDDLSRPSLKGAFELIHEIRKDSVKHFLDANSPWEYFASLYVISFRQILYGDLNQRYAYESARVVGEYLVEKPPTVP